MITNRLALASVEAEYQAVKERDVMNIAEQVSQPEATTESKPPTIRDTIESRIREAHMPQATKKFATRLLQQNASVGTSFRLSMATLRKMRHAATNLDVIKCLARLRRVGLVTYSVEQQAQQVTLQFIVNGK
jgi:hypothetical protein